MEEIKSEWSIIEGGKELVGNGKWLVGGLTHSLKGQWEMVGGKW